MVSNNAGRIAVWVTGLILLLAGVWFLWDAAGLDQYISRTALIAAIFLIGGIAAMAFAASQTFWGERREERVERTYRDEPRRAEPQYRTERPADYDYDRPAR